MYLFGYLFLMEGVQVYLRLLSLEKSRKADIVLRVMPGSKIKIKGSKTDEKGDRNYDKPFCLCPWPPLHKWNSSDLLYEIISSWVWWLEVKREKLDVVPRNENDGFFFLPVLKMNSFCSEAAKTCLAFPGECVDTQPFLLAQFLSLSCGGCHELR